MCVCVSRMCEIHNEVNERMGRYILSARSLACFSNEGLNQIMSMGSGRGGVLYINYIYEWYM